MRILLFGPYPFLGQPIIGGVTAVVRSLAQGLAARDGLEVAVAAAHVDAAWRVEQDGRVQIYRLPIQRWPRPQLYRHLRGLLQQTAADFRPDLIHAHGSGYNAAAAALDLVLPNVITAHGVIRYEAALSGAQSLKARLAWQYDAWFEARVLRRARHCIAISPYVRRAFAHFPHLIWHDIPNPTDDACFALDPRPEPGRLLSVARVIPRKGIDTLIEGFARVAADFPQAQLRIAGETESMPEFVAQCRARAAAAGLSDRVHFLGSLDRPDLLAELSRAQVFVLAARQETAPVSILEALAAAAPVVATAVGGVPDMVEPEQSGLLVPPDDPGALAAALVRLLADPDLAAAWGATARNFAHPYRLDAVVASTLDVYKKIGSV